MTQTFKRSVEVVSKTNEIESPRVSTPRKITTRNRSYAEQCQIFECVNTVDRRQLVAIKSQMLQPREMAKTADRAHAIVGQLATWEGVI
jgi:hypothetical protein